MDEALDGHQGLAVGGVGVGWRRRDGNGVQIHHRRQDVGVRRLDVHSFAVFREDVKPVGVGVGDVFRQVKRTRVERDVVCDRPVHHVLARGVEVWDRKVHVVLLHLVVAVGGEGVGLDVDGALLSLGVGGEGDATQPTRQRALVEGVELDPEGLHLGFTGDRVRHVHRGQAQRVAVVDVERRGQILQRVVHVQRATQGVGVLEALVAHGVGDVDRVEVPPS